MIKEAIQEIERLCREAKPVHVLKPPCEPEHVYYLIEGGKATWRHAHPAPRAHTAIDLPSLAQVCHNARQEGDTVTVWYSRKGIVALLDDDTRRDRVSLPVTPSPQITLLSDWSKTVWLSQNDLVRALRLYFPRFTGGDVFRDLIWRNLAISEGAVEHGRCSIGKSLEGEVSTREKAKLPERINLSLPVYAGGALGITAFIECAVDFDVKAERLALIPPQGAVEEEWLCAEESLGKRLREALGEVEGIHVYRGAP